MQQQRISLSPSSIGRDLISGTVVFLVALPLCLGIALASNAPLISGLVAGIVGGIVVGLISGSHTSVSGPAAGLTAIVIAQIAALGSFQAFLLAVLIAGVIQIALGVLRAGFIAAFFPSAVIKGLLAAIGVILILKQIPHLFGHDSDPEGDMAFIQYDHQTPFSEIWHLIDGIHPGATIIGLASVALLLLWDRIKPLKKSIIPAPLIVVLLGVGLTVYFRRIPSLTIENAHLVQVPVAESIRQFLGFLHSPDFSQWNNPAIYLAAVTIALVASLETLLNLEAVDKLDTHRRESPPSRELLAQGVGNVTAGLLGGIPLTSVIVRSSVNVHSGARSKVSAIFHGILLLVCVSLFPVYLNMIPLACLAAILLVTGFKLASPKLVKQMWSQGRYQFLPFIITVVAIVLTDLLIGILIGLAVSTAFILYSNLRRPVRRYVERHLGGDVLHIQLANQVSFLNRAALSELLHAQPRGAHVLLDATDTDYIDPDVLDLLRDFKENSAPARGVELSTVGFRSTYQLEDTIQYVDCSTRDLQAAVTPAQVLQILKDGHERFRTNQRLTRNLARQISATADSQHPLAVVLSCIDSRTPAELIFDVGMGDIFSARVAGNITSRKVIGSIEYGCAVAGAKLVVVMGHTRCGAVTAAVDFATSPATADQLTGCQHAEPILTEIQESMDPAALRRIDRLSPAERAEFVNEVSRNNVHRTVKLLHEQSQTLQRLVREGKIVIVGAMYDVTNGDITFFTDGLPELTEDAALTGTSA